MIEGWISTPVVLQTTIKLLILEYQQSSFYSDKPSNIRQQRIEDPIVIFYLLPQWA